MGSRGLAIIHTLPVHRASVESTSHVCRDRVCALFGNFEVKFPLKARNVLNFCKLL